MGASKEEFINLRMDMRAYKDMPIEYREQMEVKSVDDRLDEYKNDETLKKLYKESAKIKDKIKIRQFEIKDLINKNKKQ